MRKIHRLKARSSRGTYDLKRCPSARRIPLTRKYTILEIRAGTGAASEAALFCWRSFSTCIRVFAPSFPGWKVEILAASQSVAEGGGIKEIIRLPRSGNRVYSRLKYEAGTHRGTTRSVTETQGRIHTSARHCRAVMPEAEEADVEIRPEDLRT